jgi:hypothetical protein
MHFFFFLLLFQFFIFIPDFLCVDISRHLFIFILAIEDHANNNIDKNEMTCAHNNNNNKNSQINNSTMVWINDQPQTYLTEHNERTISSSSSEQLIPKEKQTGKNKL